ncbi:hypothetical protein KBZ21_13360 [Streptomyces sp. A73]|nr:hypothetical protein [Streptomyces sp. A73]
MPRSSDRCDDASRELRAVCRSSRPPGATKITIPAVTHPVRDRPATAKGDELPPGVNQLVRVYVAQKRKITDGDKLAGRHG